MSKFEVYKIESDRSLISGLEDEGRFFKYWIDRADLGRCLFKAATPFEEEIGDRRMDWREKVAEQLGKLIGLPVARTELALARLPQQKMLHGSLSIDYTPDRGMVLSLRDFLTQVDTDYDRIRQEQAKLLADRSRAFEELKVAIGVDARFLLQTSQFQEFFDRVFKTEPTPINFFRQEQKTVDPHVANWSIARSSIPIRIFEYQEIFEPDDYDDQREYVSYGFEVKVDWGRARAKIDYIRTVKIYGTVENGESFIEIAEQVADRLGDTKDLDPSNPEDLSFFDGEELSYLVIYCCFLLAQKPPSLEFVYGLADEKGRNLWQ